MIQRRFVYIIVVSLFLFAIGNLVTQIDFGSLFGFGANDAPSASV